MQNPASGLGSCITGRAAILVCVLAAPLLIRLPASCLGETVDGPSAWSLRLHGSPGRSALLLLLGQLSSDC